MNDLARKVYVRVNATFGTDGSISPEVIEWEDGTQYQVERVLDVRRAASMRAGGSGIRYQVRVVWDTPEGQPAYAVSYVWREDDNKWVVEAKN